MQFQQLIPDIFADSLQRRELPVREIQSAALGNRGAGMGINQFFFFFWNNHCLWHLSTRPAGQAGGQRTKMEPFLSSLDWRLLLAKTWLQENEMDEMGLRLAKRQKASDFWDLLTVTPLIKLPYPTGGTVSKTISQQDEGRWTVDQLWLERKRSGVSQRLTFLTKNFYYSTGPHYEPKKGHWVI